MNDKCRFEKKASHFRQRCWRTPAVAEMVSKGQRLRLFQAKSRQQEFCVVTHVEPIEDGLTSVRVHFLEPHPEFWHITFPPDDWTPRHPIQN